MPNFRSMGFSFALLQPYPGSVPRLFLFLAHTLKKTSWYNWPLALGSSFLAAISLWFGSIGVETWLKFSMENLLRNLSRVFEIFFAPPTYTSQNITSSVEPKSASALMHPIAASLHPISPTITSFDRTTANIRSFCHQLVNQLQDQGKLFPTEESKVLFESQCLGPGYWPEFDRLSEVSKIQQPPPQRSLCLPPIQHIS